MKTVPSVLSKGSSSLRKLVAGSLLSFIALFASNAAAQVCTFVVVAPVFGNYTASGVNNKTTGLLTLTCVVVGAIGQNLSYAIQLGFSGSALGTQRRMASGTTPINYLNYNMFCDSGYTQIWGNGVSSTCTLTGSRSGLLGTLAIPITIYGQIPRSQYALPGTYNDSMSITVLY